jgi:hypothetical protein
LFKESNVILSFSYPLTDIDFQTKLLAMWYKQCGGHYSSPYLHWLLLLIYNIININKEKSNVLILSVEKQGSIIWILLKTYKLDIGAVFQTPCSGSLLKAIKSFVQMTNIIWICTILKPRRLSKIYSLL